MFTLMSSPHSPKYIYTVPNNSPLANFQKHIGKPTQCSKPISDPQQGPRTLYDVWLGTAHTMSHGAFGTAPPRRNGGWARLVNMNQPRGTEMTPIQ